VLTACVGDRVEGRDRASDATHSEIEEHANGRRPAPHDLVHGHVGIDLRGALGHAREKSAHLRQPSLRWHNICGKALSMLRRKERF
jgi:hypothetical protein